MSSHESLSQGRDQKKNELYNPTTIGMSHWQVLLITKLHYIAYTDSMHGYEII